MRLIEIIQRNKKVLLWLVLVIAGFSLIIIFSQWQVALGVWFLFWVQNIEQEARKKERLTKFIEQCDRILEK